MNGYRWKILLLFLAVAVLAVIALQEATPLSAAETNPNSSIVPGYFQLFIESGE